ncbi:MAG TPA: glycosyltransferase family 4 protein, partial [Gemmataceae bacterium]|nr:glycosyltransferase family 4 protein [Gemmataceae bacterium]
LRAQHYQVETVLLPFEEQGNDMVAQTLAIRSLDLTEASGNKIDLLITLRAPAHLIPHPNKVAWFQQDPHLAGSPARTFSEAKRIYAGSKTLAQRLKQSSGIDVKGVVYPCLAHPERFSSADCGDYFLYVDRLHPRNRQTLAIEAMKEVKSPFKLVLAGPAESEAYEAALHRLVRLLDLEDRVRLLGWISEEEKTALLANACGVLVLPTDADGCGYGTLEAFHARKPVVTLTDSGAPTEVIEDAFNGLIVEPQADALAAAMEKLWRAKMKAALMGRNGYDALRLHNIGWKPVLEALVA